MSSRHRSRTRLTVLPGSSVLSGIAQNTAFLAVVAAAVAWLLATGDGRLWLEAAAYGLLILGTGCWLARLILMRQAPLVFSSLGAPMLVFATYVVMRYGLSEVESLARPHALAWLGAAVAFFVILNNVRHRWQVTVFVWALAGGGVLLAVLALLVFENGAATRAVGDPVAGLQLIFPIMAANVLFSRRAFHLRVLLLLIAVVLAGALLWAAPVTAGLGSLGAGLVLVVYLIRRRSQKRRWLLIGGALLAGVLLAALIGLRAVAPPPDLPGGSAPGRLAVWRTALAVGKSHLWFGAGPGLFPWLQHTHRTVQGQPATVGNEYLQTFADYGLVGCALLLWVVIAFIVETVHILAVRAKRYSATTPSNRYAFAVGGLAAVAGLLVGAVFDSALPVPGNVLLLAVLLAATLTTGVKHRGEDPDDIGPLGTYNALSLKGISKFVVVGAALVAIALFGTRLVKTYPAAILARRGDEARRALNWDAADRYYQQAWRLDSRNFAYPLALGHLHAARATWLAAQREPAARAAVAWYDRAFTRNPHATDALVFMARLFDLLDQPADAAEHYQRALRLDPRNASYHAQFGLHLLRRGQTAEALDRLRMAYEQDGSDPLPELQLTRFDQLDLHPAGPPPE